MRVALELVDRSARDNRTSCDAYLQDLAQKLTTMKLLLVLALAVLATAAPFSDEWEDFKKVINSALQVTV